MFNQLRLFKLPKLLIATLIVSPINALVACTNPGLDANAAAKTSGQAYLNSISQIKADLATSRHNKINWNNTEAAEMSPEQYENYQPVQFSVIDFPNEAAAIAGDLTDWTAYLPASTDVNDANRFLWVRLISKSPITVPSLAKNISISSNFTSVLVQVNALAAYAAFNASNITIKITNNEVQIDESTISSSLAPYLKTAYSLLNNPWTTKAQMMQTLTANQTATKVRVLIESANPEKYYYASTVSEINVERLNA